MGDFTEAVTNNLKGGLCVALKYSFLAWIVSTSQWSFNYKLKAFLLNFSKV